MQNDGASTSSSIDHLWSTVTRVKLPPKNIVITNDTLINIKSAKKRLDQEIKGNKIDQQRVDLDVVLSGFHSKPDVSVTVEKFVKLFNLTIKDVKSFYHYENKAAAKNFHHVAISFKEKSAQMKVLKEKSEMKSPIRLNQLMATPLRAEDKNPIITCLPSLSRFNLKIQKQLSGLKSHGVISEFQMGKLFLQFKQNSASEWMEVTNENMLKSYRDLVEVRNKQLSSTSNVRQKAL